MSLPEIMTRLVKIIQRPCCGHFHVGYVFLLLSFLTSRLIPLNWDKIDILMADIVYSHYIYILSWRQCSKGLTLWYSCCMVMYFIWSTRWLKLLSRVSILSLVLSVSWPIVCSPIWMSKCSFCTTWQRQINWLSCACCSILLWIIPPLLCP